MRRKLGNKAVLEIAFLGYTDLMLSPDEWANLGIKDTKLTNRKNWRNLINIHGRSDVRVVPTLTSALDALIGSNFKLSVFDFTKYEGSEIKWDFNFPIKSKFENRFDIVVDAGTCEHIFNLPQALINIQKMLVVGGLAFHGGPLCWPNHGFYGYNPTLFSDFYEDNGCEIVETFLRSHIVRGKQFVTINGIPKYDRFRMSDILKNNPKLLAAEFNLLTFVKKINECEDITFPIQRKYRYPEQWK